MGTASFNYDVGLPTVLYWVIPDYRDALSTFGERFGYAMIAADKDLRQQAIKIINGQILHLVLVQEIAGRGDRDNTVVTNGEKLISLVNHIMFTAFTDHSHQIPSVAMRPWCPPEERSMGNSDYNVVFPPLWVDLDGQLRKALCFGYGQPSHGAHLQQDPNRLTRVQLNLNYDVEAIKGAKSYRELLNNFRKFSNNP